jgi:hypothetical protein
MHWTILVEMTICNWFDTQPFMKWKRNYWRFLNSWTKSLKKLLYIYDVVIVIGVIDAHLSDYFKEYFENILEKSLLKSILKFCIVFFRFVSKICQKLSFSKFSKSIYKSFYCLKEVLTWILHYFWRSKC